MILGYRLDYLFIDNLMLRLFRRRAAFYPADPNGLDSQISLTGHTLVIPF
jgi:hypothetical protein